MFAVYAYLGGLVWSLTFISAGYYLGEEWGRLSETVHHMSLIAALAGFFAFLVYAFYRRRRNSKPAIDRVS